MCTSTTPVHSIYHETILDHHIRHASHEQRHPDPQGLTARTQLPAIGRCLVRAEARHCTTMLQGHWEYLCMRRCGGCHPQSQAIEPSCGIYISKFLISVPTGALLACSRKRKAERLTAAASDMLLLRPGACHSLPATPAHSPVQCTMHVTPACLHQPAQTSTTLMQKHWLAAQLGP